MTRGTFSGFNLGSSISEVTKVWKFSDPLPPSVTLACLFFRASYLVSQKFEPHSTFLCDLIHGMISMFMIYKHGYHTIFSKLKYFYLDSKFQVERSTKLFNVPQKLRLQRTLERILLIRR